MAEVMAELFFAPEGAMQFEFLKPSWAPQRRTGGALLGWQDKACDGAWVSPDPNGDTCPRDHRYFVVHMQTLAPSMQAIYAKAKARGEVRTIVVCECLGRIIE